MKTTLIAEIANLCQARHNCIERGNTEWQSKHVQRLAEIEKALLPSGSGIDSGTKIDYEASNQDKVVLNASFHHMNDGGYYDGWTEHVITVTPAFSGVNIRISGRDRNEIKDYLHEVYSLCLTQVIDNATLEVIDETIKA